ncbi:hypothetical protein JT06_16565, partial [Desulfobulbus sp. Tol-SR]
MKENIQSLDYGLDTILELKTKQFDYINGSKDQFGFIAQDIQQIIPELVSVQEDGMLGLKTDMLLPIMVNAIQEQQDEINKIIDNQLAVSNNFSDLSLEINQEMTNLSQMSFSLENQLGSIGQDISSLSANDQQQNIKLTTLEADI